GQPDARAMDGAGNPPPARRAALGRVATRRHGRRASIPGSARSGAAAGPALARAPRGAEPGPAAARPGADGRGPRDHRRPLQTLHRGLRHARFAGGGSLSRNVTRSVRRGPDMAIKRITCIHFDGEFPDFCYRLVMPDYGLPVIGTILSQAGYDVRVYVEHVQPPDWARVAESDLVCFSCLNAGADKVYRLAREIKSRLGIPTVIGGTHATYFPESSLEHCDYAVLGEGDETIVELVRTLDAGGDVSKVAGIAYMDNGHVRRTPPRPGPKQFDTIPDYELIAGFRRLGFWQGLKRRHAQILTIQSSRGCPYHCTFCIVNTMFPTGYRKRDIEAVIADLRDKRRYGRHVLFVDNEFSMMRANTKALLRRMIDERLDLDIVVFARVEIVRDDELLTLMRQAGINYLYQGYESVQPETLSAYDKRQTFEQIVAAIHKLHDYGFGLLGSFVVGADSDTVETLERTVQFALEHELANAYLWPIWGHFPE